MKCYKVDEIAERTNTNRETVRRWIRSGKLKSSMRASNKEGHVINEQDLYTFLRAHPKYLKSFENSIDIPDIKYTDELQLELGMLMAKRDILYERICDVNTRIDEIRALLEKEEP